MVADVASGRVHLESIAQEQLPDRMQAMAPEEQKALITETSKHRNELQREIKKMARSRSDFLKKKVAEQGGAKDSEVVNFSIFAAISRREGIPAPVRQARVECRLALAKPANSPQT
ncbi:MAG: hypothetical protein ACREYE_09285, partial [Gammaproteobacteria bacterium]